MHIGLVVYGGLDHPSGGFRYDRLLVEYLRNRGDTVEVISLPWGSYWPNVARGFSRQLVDRLNRPFDVLLQDELCHPTLWRVNDRLTRPNKTVALVHHIQSDVEDGRLSGLQRRIERRYLTSVDGVIATSEFTKQRAQRLAPKLAEWVVAPPAGRHEGRAVGASAVRKRATEDPLRIVYLGSLVPRKNLLGVIDAVGQLSAHSENVDWQLSVLGSQQADPTYAERVRSRIDERLLDKRVDLLGEVSDETVEQTLADSHVLCVPSTYEGFGMVYLEAMEYGVVPIASANGGACEFVTDGETGALVESDEIDRISTLLAEWASDRERLAALGVAALQTAASHPTWNETFGSVRSSLASEEATSNT